MERSDCYFVYILRCCDDSLYTGITTNPVRRLQEHYNRDGAGAKYTRSRGVRSLEALWQAADKSAALKLEHAIHGLKRREKLALIAEQERPERIREGLPTGAYAPVKGVTLQDCLSGTPLPQTN